MTSLDPPGRIAAIVFDRGDDPDAPLAAFLEAARRAGARVAGLVQVHAEDCACAWRDVGVRDLASGALTPIMQDLGREATGCRVDPAAIAAAAKRLEQALESAPDLLVVNRFGKLEAEGGGMRAELGRACAAGLAVVVCVPRRFVDAWDAFAGGLDVKLPPTRAALDAWWTAAATSAALA